MDVYSILKEKGIELPAPPPKGGVYTPVQEFGTNFLYCSGCGPDIGNGNTVIGRIGESLSLEEGQKAAEVRHAQPGKGPGAGLADPVERCYTCFERWALHIIYLP